MQIDTAKLPECSVCGAVIPLDRLLAHSKTLTCSKACSVKHGNNLRAGYKKKAATLARQERQKKLLEKLAREGPVP